MESLWTKQLKDRELTERHKGFIDRKRTPRIIFFQVIVVVTVYTHISYIILIVNEYGIRYTEIT